DAVLAEPTAHGEAGVSGPDDQDLGTHVELRAPYATETVTLVGLVRASNTAERFCDCATSAAMSSSLASASMSKVTRTSLKPLRTSGSPPRMPRMSWSPSTIALTLFSWMPRFWATAATPAVRHPARAPSTVSTGAGARSSEAEGPGGAPRSTKVFLCWCSWPSPLKLSMVWRE